MQEGSRLLLLHPALLCALLARGAAESPLLETPWLAMLKKPEEAPARLLLSSAALLLFLNTMAALCRRCALTRKRPGRTTWLWWSA